MCPRLVVNIYALLRHRPINRFCVAQCASKEVRKRIADPFGDWSPWPAARRNRMCPAITAALDTSERNRRQIVKFSIDCCAGWAQQRRRILVIKCPFERFDKLSNGTRNVRMLTIVSRRCSQQLDCVGDDGCAATRSIYSACVCTPGLT